MKKTKNMEAVQFMESQFVIPSKQQLRVALPCGNGAKAQTHWNVQDPSHKCDGKG